MEVKEIYAQLKGDYQDVMSRLMKEERVIKYLKKLPATTDYQDLCNAVEAKDWPLAFRASHTLKGMAANLGLSALYQTSSDLCEQIRDKEPDPGVDMDALLALVTAEYEKTMEAIKTLE